MAAIAPACDEALPDSPGGRSERQASGPLPSGTPGSSLWHNRDFKKLHSHVSLDMTVGPDCPGAGALIVGRLLAELSEAEGITRTALIERWIDEHSTPLPEGDQASDDT